MSPERATRWTLLLTISGLVLAWILFASGKETATSIALLASALVPMVPMVRDMIARLRRRQPGVDVIALVAIGAALALGEFLTAAIIGLMLATGQYLEGYAAGRAETELTSLVARTPRTAHRVQDGRVETIDVGEVVRGDRLLVKAGEVVPVDGVTVTDSALVDEAALTGEPVPVEKRPGDLVNSGSVNAADMFEIQATCEASQSTYAGIVRLVEEARRSRPPSARLADRWAAWFVPITFGVASLAWAVSGDPIRALAVLVVATPCPLLLAVPIAIVSGISRGARRGIVFRGGGPLERLAQTRNLLIDKTGTVTVGQPSLRSIHLFANGWDADQILRLSASVDQTSAHVLARAIVDAAHQRDLELELPAEVTEVAGSGVSAKVDGREVAVGKLRWLLDDHPEPEEITVFRRRIERLAPIAIYVAIDGRIAAAMVFDDQVRSDAAHTVRALRRLGVDRVAMATGDHPVVARAVAIAIGLDDVLAEATPRDKVEALADLQLRGVTTMVGDGINDAPALAAADVGVAMGARGATASSEAADVVLVVDRLQRLVDAIGIAQRSRRIALQSATIGMGLSLIAMSFAAVGLLVPLAGALIQEGIDAVAILNALRALGGKTPSQAGPKLSPELSQRLRAEHDRLIPKLDGVRDAADVLDMIPASEAMSILRKTESFLLNEVLPHEAADENEIYPQLSQILPGSDPMAMMSRTHREIFHLVDLFRRQIAGVPPGGLEPADITDVQRVLYGLHAILRLHFDQEEEIYLSLQVD
jgi:heavy metal translocating P-type ATPase